MNQMFIYVTFQKEMIHSYPDAPEEVDYLKYPHRHMLHIKAEIEVFSHDREIEFIMLKHELEKHLNLDASTNSCEKIAQELLNYIQMRYTYERDVEIIVSEDGENGCRLVYRREKQ